MDKAKKYLYTGRVSFALWILTGALVSYLTISTSKYFSVRQWNNVYVLFCYSSVLLYRLLFNPFLWIGCLCMWRADKNRDPVKKSKWPRRMLGLLLGAVMIFLLFGYFYTSVRRPRILPMYWLFNNPYDDAGGEWQAGYSGEHSK